MAESLSGTELSLAEWMARAEDEGYGATPDSPEAVALFRSWVERGWAQSHVDNDGDEVFLLTPAGRSVVEASKRERSN